jgi:hypothetical protein
MDGILGDEPSTGNCCDIFNVWSCVGHLRNNLNLISDKSLRDQINENVNAILEEKAPAAILNTLEKIKGYQKYDGGFAHSYFKGTANHQGLPVSTGENQSDVDGTCISATGLLREMFDALNLTAYKPSMYTESDWMRYLEIMLSGNPASKKVVADTKLHDFEDGLPGSFHVQYNEGVEANTFTHTTLNGNGVGLFNKTSNQAQAYLSFKPNSSDTGATKTVFELSMMFDDVTVFADYVELRLYAGSADSSPRMQSIRMSTDSHKTGTNIYMCFATSSTEKVKIAKMGEMFKLRFEYNEAPALGERYFEVYLNDSDEPILSTDSFNAGSAIDASYVAFARIVPLKAFKGKIYFDDISFSQLK